MAVECHIHRTSCSLTRRSYHRRRPGRGGDAVRVELTNDELLTTTRTVRRRLDLQRPVERAVIEECLELAVQAPTGSNRQEWHWVFVTDPEKKRALGELYVRPDAAYRSLPNPALGPDDVRARSHPAISTSVEFLREHMGDAPVLLVPCHL